MAWRVLLKIVYLLTCRVLGLAVLVFRGDLAKDAELLVLRHEIGRPPGCGPGRCIPSWTGLSSRESVRASGRMLTRRWLASRIVGLAGVVPSRAAADR